VHQVGFISKTAINVWVPQNSRGTSLDQELTASNNVFCFMDFQSTSIL